MSVTAMARDEAEELIQALLAGRLPDARGRFGPWGGRYVPETLVPALDRLQAGVAEHLHSESFQTCLNAELRDWVGRPTALTPAPRLSDAWGAEVWLKREDLAHTGAHKINNALGQAMLARMLGAKRVIAETGAGQHGVASAAACARIGLPCIVYMGAIDCERQALNVDRMRRLGAEVVPVTSGDQTLRAAIDEALRDWVSDPEGTYYLLGSVVGPHPYPYLVRELQAVVGRESRTQIIERAGGLPDLVIACVGGGSNAIGLFHGFLADRDVEIMGIEAGGHGTDLGANSATISFGRPGVLHGCTTGRSRRPTPSRPAWITRAWGRSMRCWPPPAASPTRPPTTRRRWTPSTSAASWRGSSLRWRRPTRSPARSAGRGTTPGSASSSVCRAGATRTCRRWPSTPRERADEAPRTDRAGHPGSPR